MKDNDFFTDVQEAAKNNLPANHDFMVVTRDEWGNLLTYEHYAQKGSPEICHRFNEVAGCRTKLIDAALLLRDCFLEVVCSHKTADDIKIRDYESPS